ncbi:MAG: TCR/Tet family MFS transporter [Balneola sp.]
MSKEPRKAALAFIFITVLIDVIGLGIIIPIMPALIVELTGEGLSKAAIYGGWLMFVYAFTQFIFAPFVGSLSDKFGRRPVLLISLLGYGINYILLGFSTTIFWLFTARIVSGMTGASITTASAYIADISSPEKRSQNFGLIGAAFGLGFIIGPVVGGLLGQYGTRIPFFAAAGLTLVNVLYGFFILPESLPKENRRSFDIKRANPLGSLKQLKSFPGISGLVVVFGLIYLASHATQSTWTYYTMEKFLWDEKMVGISLGVVGLCVAIVQGGLTRIVIPKIGEVKSVYLGLTLSCLGFLGFAFSPSGAIMLAMIIPYCLGGFAGPSLQGIVSNKVPQNQQGELQGALTSLVSFTAIFGPPMMTGLFGYFTSASAPFQFSGAPFFMAALLIIGALFFAVRILSFKNTISS